MAAALVAGVVSSAMMETQPGEAAFRIAVDRQGHDVVDAAGAVRAELGLDAPALVRLLIRLGDLATLDLGRVLVTGAPVREEMTSRLVASLALAAEAFAASLAVALLVGVTAGMRPGGAVDRASFSAAPRAMPPFALAVVLILVFAVRLRWLPVAGNGGTAHFILLARRGWRWARSPRG